MPKCALCKAGLVIPEDTRYDNKLEKCLATCPNLWTGGHHTGVWVKRVKKGE